MEVGISSQAPKQVGHDLPENWSQWAAAKDDAGVQFRSSCYELSKDQVQWSIEIANGLPWSLALAAKHSSPSTEVPTRGSALHRFFTSGLKVPLQVMPKGSLVLRFAEKDCKRQPQLTATVSIRSNDSYTDTRRYVYKNGRVDFTTGNVCKWRHNCGLVFHYCTPQSTQYCKTKPATPIVTAPPPPTPKPNPPLHPGPIHPNPNPLMSAPAPLRVISPYRIAPTTRSPFPISPINTIEPASISSKPVSVAPAPQPSLFIYRYRPIIVAPFLRRYAY